VAYWSSQGGHVKLTAAVTVPVSDWEAERTSRLAETTVSTSGGERRKKVLGGGTWTFNCPWDDSQTPESLGLREGAELADMRLFLGESSLMLQFAGIVERVRYVSNATNDVVRLTVSGFVQGTIPDPLPKA
jgi:hypothetical protein